MDEKGTPETKGPRRLWHVRGYVYRYSTEPLRPIPPRARRPLAGPKASLRSHHEAADETCAFWPGCDAVLDAAERRVV